MWYNENNKNKTGGFNMTNADIVKLIKNEGFYLYQVAEKVGVSDVTFRRWLRSEHNTGNQVRILKAIEELKAGETND